MKFRAKDPGDAYTLVYDQSLRKTDIYVAVIAVAEDGAKSPLSQVLKANTGEADRDGDGIPDWYCDEHLLWSRDGTEKDIANSDEDGDGLTNLEEYLKGSDPWDSDSVGSTLPGDVNSDGDVNARDRTTLARYLAKWKDYGEDKINKTAADVNGDGQVNAKDRTILARHLAKWKGYETLPYTKEG